jgi:hypothetical protein
LSSPFKLNPNHNPIFNTFSPPSRNFPAFETTE